MKRTMRKMGMIIKATGQFGKMMVLGSIPEITECKISLINYILPLTQLPTIERNKLPMKKESIILI